MTGIHERNQWFTSDPDAIPGEGRHGAAVIVIDPAKRVLLQQRDDHTPPMGYGRWAIPGGGIEPGETPRAAAIREILEETALALEAVEYFASVYVDRHDESENSRALTIHLFYARCNLPESAIVVGEGLDFRYHRTEDLAALPFNPNGRHWLERFLSSDTFAALP